MHGDVTSKVVVKERRDRDIEKDNPDLWLKERRNHNGKK